MTTTPPLRPAWVEALNAFGRTLGDPSAMISLDADELLTTAQQRTGLSDFGGDQWREPFRLLVEGMVRDAQLTFVGRVLARQDVLRSLINRLRIAQTVHDEPAILEREIVAPILVTGIGRSGTSILHELLALDPQHHAPRTWELLYPCPPPHADSYDSDPRIAIAETDEPIWYQIMPEFLAMHENHGDTPNEDVVGTMTEFRSEYWPGAYYVPEYTDWLMKSDMGVAYRFHKQMLQLMQWGCPDQRFALKAPSHLGALDHVFATYPDAKVVLCHRDPLKVLPSLMDLMASLLYLSTDVWRHAELSGDLVAGYAQLWAYVDEQRDSGAVPSDQIVDLRYQDLIEDPVETMRNLYAGFDCEFTPTHGERITEYLAAKPKDRHTPHRYSFEDLGLDRDAVRSLFAPHLERYGVREEV